VAREEMDTTVALEVPAQTRSGLVAMAARVAAGVTAVAARTAPMASR
jgi:hypothetical protein